MKRNISIKKTVILLVVTLAVISCRKEKSHPIAEMRQLTKVTVWTTTSTLERPHLKYTYDGTGRLTELDFSGTIYTPTFTKDKLISLVAIGRNEENSFRITYDSEGRISKVKHVSMHVTVDLGDIKNFTYNAAGKISRIDRAEYLSQAKFETYTWNGDNLATSSWNQQSLTEYVDYDDKINPYYVDGGIYLMIFGIPASKNNIKELKISEAGRVIVEKRTYSYNAAGYAISTELLGTSNSEKGRNFYYDK